MNTTPKTWFITGASKGIGETLARQLLERGDRVAVTSRTLQSLEAARGGSRSGLGSFAPAAGGSD